MPAVVAVDAMGGDNAPAAVVQGAVQAVQDTGIAVLLVGQETAIRSHLHEGQPPERLKIVPADEVVEMHESASTAIRRKPDCSMRVAAALVRSGEAQAFVSAGNSGAAMAAAMFEMRMLPGADRAAIAAVLPNLAQGHTLLVDAGANVDCTPEMLLQFAAMGSAYAARVFDVERPRIGLLSIGEEECKGNGLTKAAYPLLQSAFDGFIGNVEGNHILDGTVDVVVCDGFIGNVALKMAEGTAEFILGSLKKSVHRSRLAKVGARMMGPQLRALKRLSDYAEYGGAPLLGVRGVCIIGHGRSTDRAVAQAIRLAARAASHDLVPEIQARLASLREMPACR